MQKITRINYINIYIHNSLWGKGACIGVGCCCKIAVPCSQNNIFFIKYDNVSVICHRRWIWSSFADLVSAATARVWELLMCWNENFFNWVSRSLAVVEPSEETQQAMSVEITTSRAESRDPNTLRHRVTQMLHLLQNWREIWSFSIK